MTPTVNLEYRRAFVKVETWQNADEVEITVGDDTKKVQSVNGHAEAEFVLENVRLWDGIKDPWLIQQCIPA